MKTLTADIVKAVTGIKTCQFASLTYKSKGTGEIARYTLNLNFSYTQLVEKSITELEILMAENSDWNDLQKQAANEVMASLLKTREAHAKGEQNTDYTKRGQYIHIGNGINMNTTDNSIQLFGRKINKVVIQPSQYKKVNSKPLTIEKEKIRKMLPVGQFKEFSLDAGQVEQMKVNGEILEIV